MRCSGTSFCKMTTIHEHSIRTPYPASRVQFASNGNYLALPFVRTSLGIWSLKNLKTKPLELEGHSKQVSALCFSHRIHPTLLCSAAEDYIIIWNIEKARQSYESGTQVRGMLIGRCMGYVQYVAFSPDDLTVAVCVDREVFILDTTQERLVSTLDGHTAQVNCAKFCPHFSSTLVSISEDRTFKVWNLEEGSLVYQSTIISASPFVSLAMNPLQEQFAVGSLDGQVRIYDLSEGSGFRCLHHLDISKMVSKNKEMKDEQTAAATNITTGPITISSKPAWQRAPEAQEPDYAVPDEEESDAEVGCAIMGLHYTYQPAPSRASSARRTPAFLQHNDSIVRDLLAAPPLLVIGATSAVLQINARTLELASFFDLQDPVSSPNELDIANKCLSLAGAYGFAYGENDRQTWCIVGSLFSNIAHVLRLHHPGKKPEPNKLAQQLAEKLHLLEGATSPTGGATGDNGEIEISVLSSAPLCTNSPLKAELVRKATAKPQTRRGTRGLPSSQTRKKISLDTQPLTFKSKIQSSGYTKEAPRTTMFQPKTGGVGGGRGGGRSTTSLSGRLTSQAGQESQAVNLVKEYPMNSEPPTEVKTKLDAAERPTSINKIRFSEDGSCLACALANKTAQVFRMPLTGKGTNFSGHNGVVNSVYWSRDGKWLLTSADDKSANVWCAGQSDPVMTMNLSNNNFTVDKEGGSKPSKDNPAFAKSIKHAQFYYMDKFILLTSGNAFHLYKYNLDTSKSDIKRYLSSSRYKLVKTFQMERAQNLTAFSAVNGFYSYVALCAGSNKAVEVFDLNVGKSVRVILDAQTRPIHAICQNEGSPYVSHPASAYDLFLTAAAGDAIKLWDLRTNRCVRRYEGHANRVYPCGLALSPCSRFIASGAEDKSAYIFDVRSSSYLHKLIGHTDTVAQVAYHPLHPQLVTASVDGKIRLYMDH